MLGSVIPPHLCTLCHTVPPVGSCLPVGDDKTPDTPEACRHTAQFSRTAAVQHSNQHEPGHTWGPLKVTLSDRAAAYTQSQLLLVSTLWA